MEATIKVTLDSAAAADWQISTAKWPARAAFGFVRNLKVTEDGTLLDDDGRPVGSLTLDVPVAAPSVAALVNALQVGLFGVTSDADNNGGKVDRAALAQTFRAALAAQVPDAVQTALRATTAHVELYTGNGVTEQPSPEFVQPNGDFDTEKIAAAGRAALAGSAQETATGESVIARTRKNGGRVYFLSMANPDPADARTVVLQWNAGHCTRFASRAVADRLLHRLQTCGRLGHSGGYKYEVLDAPAAGFLA